MSAQPELVLLGRSAMLIADLTLNLVRPVALNYMSEITRKAYKN